MKGLMDILIKKKGRVKDEGVKKGKKSIAEVIGMKRKKKKGQEAAHKKYKKGY